MLNQKLENVLHHHRSWEDVVGNRVAVATLKKLLALHRPQPLLITGMFGTGKTAIAELYANYFLADIDPTHQRAEFGTFARYHNCTGALLQDVKEWFGADAYCGKRVIVLDEADMLSNKSERYIAPHSTGRAARNSTLFL